MALIGPTFLSLRQNILVFQRLYPSIFLYNPDLRLICIKCASTSFYLTYDKPTTIGIIYMKRTALSSAVLCSVLLTACSTAEIPRTVPENSASYDQTASYAQNLGRQFGILKITDAMTGTEQCASVKTETHLARNLGVTLLANSPLQDLSKSVSKGPFSTGVGLDFANLGWKNDTVYFEILITGSHLFRSNRTRARKPLRATPFRLWQKRRSPSSVKTVTPLKTSELQNLSNPATRCGKAYKSNS